MSKKPTKLEIENRFMTRRQFLFSGGTMLMLPPLLSLMPRSVLAQALNPSTRPKRLCLMPMLYGMYPTHLQPTVPANLLTRQNAPGSTSIGYSYAKLSELPDSLSYVVNESLSDLKGDLNIYAGLDQISHSGHTWGLFSGGVGGNNAEGRSIDVILPQSAAFKASFRGKEAVIRQGSWKQAGTSSHFYDRTKDASGRLLPGIENFIGMSGDREDGKIFEKLFSGVTQGSSSSIGSVTGVGRKEYLIDRVIDDFRELKNSRRISSVDKTLLSQFADNLYEVQSKIQVPAPLPTQACQKPNINFQLAANSRYDAPVADWDQYWRNIFEMVALAFSCDQSRIFTSEYFKPYGQDHHNIDDSEAEYFGTKHQKDWIHLMAQHLVRRLKGMKDPFGNGTETLLDNTLILWANEHSYRAFHGHANIPIMTFGRLGTETRSGYYMDFDQKSFGTGDKDREHRGFPQKMLLVAIMKSMGMTDAEIDREGDGKGFGNWPAGYWKDENSEYPMSDFYDMAYFNQYHSEPLPFFKV